ncbi:FAD-dependent oxidoreductase, partial [candidate division TA06 bacterium]
MVKDKKYDIIIIGAGPAGLFAAYELIDSGKSILIIDKGKSINSRKCPILEKITDKCVNCKPCGIMSGVGGAGLFSDGKLNFIHKLGKTDLTEFMNEKDACNLIDYTETIFNKFNMNGETFPASMEKAKEIKGEAKRAGIDLLIIKQKHLGSDRLPGYITGVVSELENKGVEIIVNREVLDLIVVDNTIKGVVTDKGNIFSEYIIAAPGRVGARWLAKIANKLKIKTRQRGIEVGVRVEIPAEVSQPITDTIYDPTFFIYTDTYDDLIRTFCTNRNGFVARESYVDFACVNGYANKDTKSENTNFAFLSTVVLTHPVTDTYKYGLSIGRLSSTIGGGKPIIQRLIDLKRGRRSTWERINKSYIKLTFADVTPGDISMALPHRIVTNVLEGLNKLNRIIPGVTSNETLIYAPEIKFFSVQISTKGRLETSIKNLF